MKRKSLISFALLISISAGFISCNNKQQNTKNIEFQKNDSITIISDSNKNNSCNGLILEVTQGKTQDSIVMNLINKSNKNVLFGEHWTLYVNDGKDWVVCKTTFDAFYDIGYGLPPNEVYRKSLSFDLFREPLKSGYYLLQKKVSFYKDSTKREFTDECVLDAFFTLKINNESPVINKSKRKYNVILPDTESKHNNLFDTYNAAVRLKINKTQFSLKKKEELIYTVENIDNYQVSMGDDYSFDYWNGKKWVEYSINRNSLSVKYHCSFLKSAY